MVFTKNENYNSRSSQSGFFSPPSSTQSVGNRHSPSFAFKGIGLNINRHATVAGIAGNKMTFPSDSSTCQATIAATTPVKDGSSASRRRRVTSETEVMTVSPYSKSSTSSSSLCSSNHNSCHSSPSSSLPPPIPIPPQSPASCKGNRLSRLRQQNNGPKSPPRIKKSKFSGRHRLTTSATEEELQLANVSPEDVVEDESKDDCEIVSLSNSEHSKARSAPRCSLQRSSEYGPNRLNGRTQLHAIDGDSASVVDMRNHFIGENVPQHQPRKRSHQYHSVHGENGPRSESMAERQSKIDINLLAQQAGKEEENYFRYHVNTSNSHEKMGSFAFALNILEQAIHAISVEQRDGGYSYQTLVIASPLRRGYLLYRSGLILWKMGSYIPSLARLRQARDIFEHASPQEQQIQSTDNSASAGVDSVVAAAVGVGEGSWSETMTEINVALGKVSLSMGNTAQGKRYLIKALRMLELDSMLLENDGSDYCRRMQLLQSKVLRQLGSIFLATIKDTHSDPVKKERAAHKAGTALLESLRLQQSLFSEEERSRNPDYALTLQVLGQYHESEHDYENAAIMYLDALDVYRVCLAGEGNFLSPTLPSCRVDMGVTLAHIGWLYYLNQDYEEARNVYQEAYDLISPILGSCSIHANIASLHLKIGMLYAATHQWQRAMKRYRAALEIQRQIHRGDNNESVAQTLCLIASCLAAQESLPCLPLERATCRTSNSLPNKPNLYKALGCLDQALRIRVNLFGHGNLSVAKTLVTMGKIQRRVARYKQAADSIAWALKICQTNALDASHPLLHDALIALR